MDDTGSSEFRMRIDDDGPDREMQEEIEDQRISKLNQRVTLISILIPCLIGSILLFIYLDIQSNVTTTLDTESKTVQSLTKGLDSRVSSLSAQNEALKNDVAGSFSSIEKTLTSLKGKIEKNRRNVAWTRKIAATKETLTSALSKTDESIAVVDEGLKSLSTDVKDFQDTMAQELTRFSETSDSQMKSVEDLRAALSELSSEKIDKRDLYVLLEDRQKVYRKRVGQMIKDVEKELAILQRKIRVLEAKTGPSGTATPPASERKETLLPESGKSIVPSDRPAHLTPGTIIEQDIQ